MTTLWVCQHDSLPLVSIVNVWLRPWVTMLTRGSQSCWQPHSDVIFVYCNAAVYRTHVSIKARADLYTALKELRYTVITRIIKIWFLHCETFINHSMCVRVSMYLRMVIN